MIRRRHHRWQGLLLDVSYATRPARGGCSSRVAARVVVRSLRSLSRVFPTSRLARHYNVLLKIVARRALRSRCRSPRAVAACRAWLTLGRCAT